MAHMGNVASDHLIGAGKGSSCQNNVIQYAKSASIDPIMEAIMLKQSSIAIRCRLLASYLLRRVLVDLNQMYLSARFNVRVGIQRLL